MSYQQVQNKPTGAYTLSLIGGILGVLGGIGFVIYGIWIYVEIASYLEGYYGGLFDEYVGLFGLSWTAMLAVGILVLIFSMLIIVFARKLNEYPMEHSKWGALILIFSIIGSFNIIALIGGILALTYKPIPVASQPYGYPPQQPVGYAPQYAPTPQYAPQPTQQTITRICPQCGRVVNENVKYCPHCGKQLN
ncbi:MAG: zinc-ribbon domain-containing protein [Candidatus Bathyarchaeia archaeon]